MLLESRNPAPSRRGLMRLPVSCCRGAAPAPVVKSIQPTIRVCNAVTPEDVRLLVRRKIAAVVVPNYLNGSVARAKAEELQKHGVADYDNAPGVGKGKGQMAFFETGKDEARIAAYHKATNAMGMVRGRSPPGADNLFSPLHAMLSNGPDAAGTGPMDLGLGPMPYGLTRVFKSQGKALPHEDKLERDVPGDMLPALWQTGYQGQLAANVYLQVPAVGGELHLWPHLSYSTEEYDVLRGKSYGIPRGKLPEPSLKIKPRAGDLILFNSRNVHAVSGVPAGQVARVTCSSFIAYCGVGRPLLFWS